MHTLSARAHHLAAHLRPTPSDGRRPGSGRPFLSPVDGGGWVATFSYGVAVTFGLDDEAETRVLAGLAPQLESPSPRPEVETALIRITGTHDGVGPDAIELLDLDPHRILVVAEVLARSVVLADLEAQVGHAFDRVDPLTRRLSAGLRPDGRERDLLAQIGGALMTRMRTLGRVEVGEKPELLWDHPDLEPLFARLSAEYDLVERDRALTRKIDLVSDVSGTLFDLLQSRQMLRVEWYIVILILFDIVLTLWGLGH